MLKLIFLRHNIKDGGYNSTNIKKQLSPAQNTPKLQATKYINDPSLYKPSLQSPTVLFLKKTPFTQTINARITKVNIMRYSQDVFVSFDFR